MARNVLLALLVGVFVMAMGGVASAEAPIMGSYSSNEAIHQSVADPEFAVGQGESLQERGPVETGSMPASQGNSPELRCCSGDSGPTQGEAGETVLRQGIDDGP